MKIIETVFATTHVDAHNEQITREALESMVQRISSSYLPFIAEHDPRNAPLGRVRSAYVRARPDGEYEIAAEIELFEEGDEPVPSGDGRKLLISRHDANGLTIEFDRTYRFDEDQADISQIAELFGNPAVEQCKKSLDPISIIEIAGTFAVSSIAAGFFGQIGADGWNLLKEKLANLFARRANREKGQLLIFKAVIEDPHNLDDFEVQVIITNPTRSDIESTLFRALRVIDLVLPVYASNLPGISRFVFETDGDEVELRFVVRSDCLPLVPTQRTGDILKALKRRSNNT